MGICEASVVYGASSKKKISKRNESPSHISLTSEEADWLTPVEEERIAWNSRMV